MQIHFYLSLLLTGLNFSLCVPSFLLLGLISLLKGFNVTPPLSFEYLNVGFYLQWGNGDGKHFESIFSCGKHPSPHTTFSAP